MDDILGKEWEIKPAGGATGEAYFAQSHNEKLFLKRNSSPFLAVLSAEGIVPKLIWTKRLENGDVVTAQRWMDGHELKANDMTSHRVAQLLSKIHRSTDLLNMLKRLGKQPMHPTEMCEHAIQATQLYGNDILVRTSIDYLSARVEKVQLHVEKVVCHGDVNHNNWLMSAAEELYLIDWEGAVVADPALDIGMILHWYVPQEEWTTWLAHYGEELTPDLEERMKWYVVYQSVVSMVWHRGRNETREERHWTHILKTLLVQLHLIQ
ncbi:phosphotransferase family protein [Aureibacillus halotolerans]|uniref:phosphotransferase n=1 Tax=Aureibacillus halotolerans TaxID=1508390 RepID=UPI00105C841B|nr:phosphotransferase family protein [Aureibacillus halotolerans]